ncbi:MAG: electron transport complex subunit RsxC [Deltaproteobacteria bacterium]|nr:electron transport complex subunit RsxC [Deltaproteobacteria bacterium]
MSLFNFKKPSVKGGFRHGIHPPENKGLSETSKIEVVKGYETVTLPLLQHVGAPAKQIVEPKQEVKFGQMVAAGEAFISASIHSPVAGVVKNNRNVTMVNGRRIPAVVIKSEGEQVDPGLLWAEMIADDWALDRIPSYDPQQISKIIRDSGIVGLGGAAFPAHVKIAPNDKKPINTLLINGCECEPYLTSDYRLMIEAPHAIVAGAIIAAHALSAGQTIICIEDNKPEAIRELTQAGQGTSIKIAALKTKYPQGGEKQLIKSALGLEVPLGGLPGDIGVTVSNTGTMAAIAMALLKGRALTHRVLSVSGKGINSPKNLFIPIGISIGEIIRYCGGLREDACRIVAGGPMMGFAFSDLTTPVIKGNTGIIVLSKEEISEGRETSCIRCGKCVDACPMNLVPTRLAMASRYNNPDIALKYHINACFECGCCAYVCPAKINLVQLIRSGKRLVANQQALNKR